MICIYWIMPLQTIAGNDHSDRIICLKKKKKKTQHCNEFIIKYLINALILLIKSVNLFHLFFIVYFDL